MIMKGGQFNIKVILRQWRGINMVDLSLTKNMHKYRGGGILGLAEYMNNVGFGG